MTSKKHTCSVALLLAISALVAPALSASPIDRQALVTRHAPHVTQADALSPFSVGNGEFAVTVDVTGLQTFPDYYEAGIPLGTLSHWGWHSVANADGHTLAQTFAPYDTYGRQVDYAARQHTKAGQWLRANPHRLHLGRVGFVFRTETVPASPEALSSVNQQLDLWRGVINSRFSVGGETVAVETAAHPGQDQLAARVQSPLLARGQLGIELVFPYGSLSWGKATADWTSPERHSTRLLHSKPHSVLLERQLDQTRYYVSVSWEGKAAFSEQGPHRYTLMPEGDSRLSFSVRYLQHPPSGAEVSAGQTLHDAREHWQNFWQAGGAIDLSGSKDPRAYELERRIILSRYLTAIQTAGNLPPAETGLTYNSWYGKFHLEMHWWHGVHYVLWGKSALFEKSLPWYQNHLAAARATATRQGYTGARWPKMVGPTAAESPSTIGVFLIWQQPHPIYYAELLYRTALSDDQRQTVLNRYRELVFATADFMASYAHWDQKTERYVLGPPLIPAQEIYAPTDAINPAFELAYWRYGLNVAQLWRNRFGLAANPEWQKVLDHLADLPQRDGAYVNAENALETFTDASHRNDHPSVLGAYGMLPGVVDPTVMMRTLEQVFAGWNWDRTWGWDYPMAAMSAARLGRPDLAIDALLMDIEKNHYLNNGHNYQDENLTLYLPGNGGLLAAVAMMAAGWEGAPDRHAPGFPRTGWQVQYENISPFP